MIRLISLICLIGLAGCLSPERAPLFAVDWDDELREVERKSTTLPAPPSPAFNDLPDLSAIGDEPIELSIEQAAALALTRNRELSVEQLGPVITGSFELIEEGVFDPELFAEIEYGRDRASEVDRGTGGQFAVDAEGVNSIAGVRQRLPTGTDVELRALQSRDTSSRSPEQQEAEIGITVTQALLRGFGPSVNLADVRQARLDTKISRYELRGYVEALLAEVESAYWNYTLAVEQIRIFERSLELAERQLEDVRQRIEVGVNPRAESAAAEAEVALRQQGLIDARAELEAQQYSLLRLLDATGADGALDRTLRLTSDATIEPRPLDDLPSHVALGLRFRPDLAEARLRLERDRLEVIQTRNGLLPRLDVFVTLGKTGFADSFGGSFENLATEDTFDAVVGGQFSYPLGNDVARGQNRAAVATRLQAARAIENLRQLVRLDIRLAAVELRRAGESVAASARTRELQEATVQAEQDRFDAGASTALLVAQAQRDLVAAEIAEVEAVIAYRLARIALYRAEGTLLARRGIRLDGAASGVR